MRAFDDETIAGTLTYIGARWGPRCRARPGGHGAEGAGGGGEARTSLGPTPIWKSLIQDLGPAPKRRAAP